ncbi:LysR family transcriptional regulator [Corynebacterium sp. 153RC1]|uniref:LysR family transcriptional regulator n=1 Tax=Corynebacterium TaxID=1716 RepID=UPI00211BE59C|nr:MULTISPECIES: LysR family transcriptional regulator [unclassified Corynebacterium]MCQ9371312.1 LysR family transcriptional regulator [Corynebacterium sp. 35RC1]MCQ9343296.1 LysR family transcriptional regulator [Corynebacterium sp. 76QC2CO]MCQ9351920.1 LysR family transcriptional regulator [Corynebacterium sp. 209RC1]MCQ9353669.1 LysR family transcriptional regulator [Corynebacterium sp. 1222RC1]MCQ9356347.1 LysR family transcriptional regulator [Corynebacterium sp. 122RC1]
MLHLSFVTGTEPGKWFERYRDRTTYGLETTPSDDPLAQLLDPSDPTNLALVRLPDERALSDTLHLVRLYEESPGVALPKEHTLTLFEPVPVAELAGEHANYLFPSAAPGDIAALRDALGVVAANVGYATGPRPLLKVLSGKQIEHRELAGADFATQIALVWHKTDDGEMIQDFVGIAKGRTLASSRQADQRKKPTKKRVKKPGQRPAKKASGNRGGRKRK